MQQNAESCSDTDSFTAQPLIVGVTGGADESDLTTEQFPEVLVRRPIRPLAQRDHRGPQTPYAEFRRAGPRRQHRPTDGSPVALGQR